MFDGTANFHTGKPTFFDWGLAKEHGTLIFFLSGLLYCVCIVGTVWLIRRAGRQTGYRKCSWLIGSVALFPMALAAVASLDKQTTTAHYQEGVHVAALIIIGTSFGLIVAASIVAEVVVRMLQHRER